MHARLLVRWALAAVVAVIAAAGAGVTLAAQAAGNGEAITPFRIRVPDADLKDLKDRLARARYPDELPDGNWDYGTNTAYLKTLIAYWRDKYDWRAQERMLNTFDQFKTTIDGVEVHFVHQRSKNPNARPLLLLNGWPSSLVEYHKVIGPLTDPVAHGGRLDDSYHVVIPTMPGYGFSGKQPGRGYSPERVGRMWIQLMARLGYSRYFIEGSDWGQIIAPRIALRDAAHVAGLHIPACGPATAPDPATAPTVNRAVDAAHNLGYQEIQATKPQTLGVGLSDSPVGLASWIIDKWFAWSDHDGELEKIYSRDDLITNVMLYWLTNSGTSSTRLYYESRHPDGTFAPSLFQALPDRVTVPTGCGSFWRQYDRRGVKLSAGEAEARKALEGRYNLVHFAIMPRGGHFPALEQPTLFVDDLRSFLRARQ